MVDYGSVIYFGGSDACVLENGIEICPVYEKGSEKFLYYVIAHPYCCSYYPIKFKSINDAKSFYLRNYDGKCLRFYEWLEEVRNK